MYDNDAGKPHRVDITTTVTTDEGKVLIKTEEARDSSELQGRRGGYGHAARLALKDLPPGPYVLTISAQVAARRHAFRRAPGAIHGHRSACGAFTMRSSMLVLVLAALLQPTPPAPAVRTLGKGPMSAIEEPRQVTLRSAAEWGALWKENGAAEPVPAVDFSREMVVGIFVGSRPTAGYGVEIVRTVGNKAALIVEYVETTPSRDAITAQILTAPYHLAAVPKHDGTVTFRKVDK